MSTSSSSVIANNDVLSHHHHPSLVGLNVTPARRRSAALLRAVAPLSAFRSSPLSFLDFVSSGARNRFYIVFIQPLP